MFLEILLAIVAGVSAGVITGLTPGIHVNLVSVFVVGMSGFLLSITSPIPVAVFLLAMSITHTFTDAIPSIFLGAPDPDTCLNVLPGHKMLLQGKGFDAVKLTIIGSLLSLLLMVLLLPFFILTAPTLYVWLQPFIGWILLGVVLYVIWIERGWRQKIIGGMIFLLSGLLGIVVFDLPTLNQPLFAMLSGLFGVSTLLISLNDQNNIPVQQYSPVMKL